MNSAILLVLALSLSAEPAAEPTPPPSPPAAGPQTAPPPAPAPAPAGAVLTLDQALKEAQEKNLDLKQAQARIKQVEQAWYRVLAQYLPQISVGGTYTRNQVEQILSLPTQNWIRTVGPNDRNGPPFNPAAPELGAPSEDVFIPDPSSFLEAVIQKKNQVGGQLSVQQALIVPALWPAFELADLGEALAAQNVEAARREILFGVAQLYYGAVSLKQVIEVQERLLQNNLEHERDAKVRVDAGALPKIGLIRAQIDRARAEQDVLRARASYAQAKVALSTLLDREADFEVAQPAEPQLPEDMGRLEAAALQQRPDVLAARTSRELAEKSKRSNYYSYLPSILGRFVYQGANIKGFSDSYFSWSASLVASWTIWDGGLREANLREARAKVLEAEAALRGAEIKARDDVKRALLDLELARANSVKAQEQVKLARENMHLVTVNYQAGAATQIEVSDANTALSSAELGAVAETLNAHLSALKVLKAAGAFNPQP